MIALLQKRLWRFVLLTESTSVFCPYSPHTITTSVLVPEKDSEDTDELIEDKTLKSLDDDECTEELSNDVTTKAVVKGEVGDEIQEMCDATAKTLTTSRRGGEAARSSELGESQHMGNSLQSDCQ